MMKQWYSVRELTGLINLPTTTRGLHLRAKEHQWKARKRKKGEGNEYHISSLPVSVQLHLESIENDRLQSLRPNIKGKCYLSFMIKAIRSFKYFIQHKLCSQLGVQND
jgi:hypothetical protein